MGVRRDVVEGADELLVGQRLAVDADPLVHPLEVGAGEPARAQVEGAQQGVDHPAGRGLAVGAGQLDHRVVPLRVAEQLGERADPVERRLEPGLRPAGEQGVLRLGEGLGESGWLDRGLRRVAHLAPTLLSGRPPRQIAASPHRPPWPGRAGSPGVVGMGEITIPDAGSRRSLSYVGFAVVVVVHLAIIRVSGCCCSTRCSAATATSTPRST